MFIRKSKHDEIVENLHYNYGRTEFNLEKEIKRLQLENENLKIRLNKALDIQEKPRPSRSESITKKIQSYSTPSKSIEIIDNNSDIINAVLISSLVSNSSDSSSDYSSNSSCDSSSSYDSGDSSSCFCD